MRSSRPNHRPAVHAVVTLLAMLGLLVPASFLPASASEHASDSASERGSVAPMAAAAVTTLTASNFRYARSATSTLVSALDAALPNVSMGSVAADGNRTGVACSAPVTHRVASFCWSSGDRDTTEWYPQGITTSADAYGEATYDGRRILLASWYDSSGTAPNKGVRISVVDLTAGTAAPSYRHILLVEPSGTTAAPSFKPVPVHAGGIMWYGNLLYVADTSNGFRVFDLDHLWQVSTGDESKVGRQSDGSFHAHNYKYVLPQTARFTDSTVGGYAQLRHSSVALDRTSSPDSVVVTEYQTSTDLAGGSQVRTVRIPIDYTNRFLKPASDGIIKATEAYRIDLESVQGSVAVNGELFYSQSDGTSFSDPSSAGDLHTWDAPSGAIVRHGNALAVGAEDLSYDPTRDQMWSLSEHPGYRWVYAFDASSFASSF
ncbi:hypothetical protein [Antribacter gilvus]|uniref:hypothetical protein n=1 Tax=Antribacter gilvus TaxID=2304675 RepID=UPI001F0CDC6C|nr:hypothetical protein [Antribacter gilvus]